MILNAIHWNVDPVLFHIGSFGLRWYSLGFLCAFVLGYLILSRIFKHEKGTAYQRSYRLCVTMRRSIIMKW